ncbi:MAG: hypothetical protein M0Q22_12225 [Sulfuritalea sp.]|jgi:hypothetical protein|nr:hypothetical protein [Sulfuritalea sp.]
MASISSLSGAQSAAQSGLAQLRLQQAKREAEQADQVARSLQAQAQSAQLKASQADQEARAITTQADVAESSAGQARQGLALVKTSGQMQTQLSGVVTQVVEKQKSAAPPAPVQTPAAPVTNVQGQVTGTVINTTA